MARLVLVNGVPGLAWAPGGQPRVVFEFSIGTDKIAGITLVADADHIGRLVLEFLNA